MTDIAKIQEQNIRNKTIIVRVDFNVPFTPGTKEISDDSRIRSSLPTLQYLLDKQCKVLICTHLGRPGGIFDDKLSLKPIATKLSEILGVPVPLAPDSLGPDITSMISEMKRPSLLMLENIRFHPGEENNDQYFAAELAKLADCYVNDAFGSSHRALASTEGITKYIPSSAGHLLQKEVTILEKALDRPERPLIAILGGAKVSDKIQVMKNLLTKVDKLIIGGGMANTFLKANGKDIADSLFENDHLDLALEIQQTSSSLGIEILLPEDFVVSDSFNQNAKTMVGDIDSIPPGWMIMDIGPKTAKSYSNATGIAKTIIWNGPMGVSEWKSFSNGTLILAKKLAQSSNITTVIGGGSTGEAIASFGLTDKMSHVSTGGGASLEFLEGKILPGLTGLKT